MKATKEQFIAAYGDSLKANCPWASESPDKLQKFLSTVEKAINSLPGGNWSPSGQSFAKAAWRAIGGKGLPTIKPCAHWLENNLI